MDLYSFLYYLFPGFCALEIDIKEHAPKLPLFSIGRREEQYENFTKCITLLEFIVHNFIYAQTQKQSQ